MTKDVIKLPPGKVIPATNDVVFKNLIHKNKDFLAKLISIVTKLDYNYLLDNIYLSDTNSLDNNIYKHHNNQDVIVTINNLTII